MPTGILNRGTIVSNGLSLGGNPNLVTRANTFLNLILDHIHRTYDFDYTIKENATLTVTAGNYDVSLASITDYRAIRQLELIGTQGGKLMQVDFLRFMERLNRDLDNNSPRGVPTHFAMKPDSSTFRVYPISDASYTFRLYYYSLPTTLSLDSDVPAYPDHYGLVQALAFWCANYERESTQTIIKTVSEALWQGYRNASKDFSRSESQEVIQLDASRFKASPYNNPNGWISFDRKGPGT